MKKIKKYISLVFVVAVTSGISYCTYNFLSAEDRVKELCSQIKPGMSLEELRSFSEKNALGPEPNVEGGITFIFERKTYGRFGCKIIMENKIVRESSYD